MRKGVIYARYSSDNQRDESIDAQIRAIEEYAKANDIIIIKVYADEARSATTDDRPEFLEMVSDSSRGFFDCVLVHKLDRFARNRYDSAIYKKKLADNGVRIISVLENLDDSPESIILESVLEGMNEYYSANLAREVRKGMNENALQCKHNGGLPPLGYDVSEDLTYEINPKEADAVRTIFNMYSNGSSYGEIKDELKENNHKTQTGRNFSNSSIYEILRNEKYRGVYIFNRTIAAVNGVRNNRKSKSEDEITRVENGMPRIIDDITWNAARERMNSNRRGANSAKEVYLLSGKIECGECGGSFCGERFTGGRNKDIYITYGCSTRKRTNECNAKRKNRDLLENLVFEILQESLFDKNAIKNLIKEMKKYVTIRKSNFSDELRMYSGRIARVVTSINNIVKSIENGAFTPKLNIRLKELEKERSDLEHKLNNLKVESNLEVPSEKDLLNIINKYGKIESLSVDEKKGLINRFVGKIIVHENRISVFMDVPFTGGGGGS